MIIGFGGWLSINPNHLLPRGVRHSGENARLRHSRVAFCREHTAERHMFVPEEFQQQTTWFVIAQHAHRQNVDAQVREVVDGIRAAAGHNRSFSMLENQNRRLARNARDFPENELIGYQISHDCDGCLGEGFDDPPQPLGLAMVVGHSEDAFWHGITRTADFLTLRAAVLQSCAAWYPRR